MSFTEPKLTEAMKSFMQWRRYRIRHVPTNRWWEGHAQSPEDAVRYAREDNRIFREGELDIKVKTRNGCGGWAKVRV
jgi:hypothetical protein